MSSAKNRAVFVRYPRPHGFFEAVDAFFGNTEASMKAIRRRPAPGAVL